MDELKKKKKNDQEQDLKKVQEEQEDKILQEKQLKTRTQIRKVCCRIKV